MEVGDVDFSVAEHQDDALAFHFSQVVVEDGFMDWPELSMKFIILY